jgi:transcriptional regulator with XRE-family HTH domain
MPTFPSDPSLADLDATLRHQVIADECGVERGVTVPPYGRLMPWSIDERRARHPELQLGWEIVGRMVKRRRLELGWTQRELSRRCGLVQSAICRLENGKLRGLRFKRFVAIVVGMGGLDPGLPAPAPRPMIVDLFVGARDAEDADLPSWLPHRDGPNGVPRERPAIESGHQRAAVASSPRRSMTARYIRETP